jgi:hypothetical protein
MIRIANLAAVSLSLVFAQGAFAAQDTGLGYDPDHQFGYARPVAGTTDMTTASTSRSIGFEVDYVYGSDARMAKPAPEMLSTVQQRDALGAQPGA